ncbi:PAS domain S-box-containing protein [Rhodoblastus acidophilus]|uniref:PAS domain-containing sensor histidine kinase n=1 Tax=Rhodoblastus acidophilus TaxID=1074 RepID=UPI002225357E|nr:histidine kinase [Rhodoblastus acidophilus]MCW2283004.1 PAS domain S-box-containing protein [Rhodoblastus acidophilus]MCW2331945.1 PAS domain S-box-containing protein [Rhodoblastus acidophilus]
MSAADESQEQPDLASDLAPALDLGLFAFARIGPDLTVRAVQGRLLDWLPPIGAPLADTPVFFGLDAQLAALRDGARLDLPGLRLPPKLETPFDLTLVHEPRTGGLLLYAAADAGVLEFERQLAHERRQSQILADQAASAGRVLREQAALYRDIVENDSDLVLRLGPDLRISFVNTAVCRLLGLTEALILGRPVDDLLDSAPEEVWRARFFTKSASYFEQAASFEQAARRADGERIWIWWRVHWVSGGAEYQAIGRDITDLLRLRADAAARAEEARANAVMRERLRIAHALHDTLVHSLVALSPQIRLIRKTAGADAPTRLKEELAFAEQAVRDGLSRARAAIADLRSQTLEREGLGAALEGLARRFGDRTGVHVLVDLDARAATLAPEVADTFYRIAEEGLRNAELHAQPTRVGVTLAVDETGAATLVIDDNGRGFDPDQPPSGHFGLIGIRERAEMIGARFNLASTPGVGTRIVVVAQGG